MDLYFFFKHNPLSIKKKTKYLNYFYTSLHVPINEITLVIFIVACTSIIYVYVCNPEKSNISDRSSL